MVRAGLVLGSCYRLWSGEEGAEEAVLTGGASRPGARSHLQQSKEEHVRLARSREVSEVSPQHLPLPRAGGFSNISLPRGALGARRSPGVGS